MDVFLPSSGDGSCGLTGLLSGRRRLPVPATFSPEWAVTWLLEKSKGGLLLRSVGRSAYELIKSPSKPACRSEGGGAGFARFLEALPLAVSVAWGKSFNLPVSPPGTLLCPLPLFQGTVRSN